MTIDNDTPRDTVGTLTRGNITIVGMITEQYDEDFVFVTEGIELNLDGSDWEFTVPPTQPKPGWYSHNEYPVSRGFSPVWLDGEGNRWTFSLKKQGEDGKTEPLLFTMDVPWDQLTPLEETSAAPA